MGELDREKGVPGPGAGAGAVASAAALTIPGISGSAGLRLWRGREELLGLNASRHVRRVE